MIKAVNKNNNCLCPFCMKPYLYFDSDYIPMNYSFVKLAHFYYYSSSLGCTFKEIKKILRKNIKVINDTYNEKDIKLNNYLIDKRLKALDEKIMSKNIYDILIKKENNMEYEISIYIDEIQEDISLKLFIFLITLIEVLINSIYLKNIIIKTENKNIAKNLEVMITSLYRS